MLDISVLNAAQREAVTASDGPVLVIAGAGSGKTRTLVYRMAWLVEQGIPAHAMLLLTFTRKAAQEMLQRSAQLLGQGQSLGQGMGQVRGGTFHGFAFSVLRQFPPEWAAASKGALTVMDSADSASCLQHCKEALKLGKGDRSFPKAQAVLGLMSKARNKEMDMEEVLRREAQHLLPHAEALCALEQACRAYRKEHCLLDYDDLLFEFEHLLRVRPEVLAFQRQRYGYIMVDEYQDTNRVQARLVQLLAGSDSQTAGEQAPSAGNIMAVGDDAQSIYAFRGATVNNILEFPQLFPGTRIVRLEENYRSVQPVLNVANALLENAPVGYRKHLFSQRPVEPEPAVHMYRPLSDLSQAQVVARRIEELLLTKQPDDIAVLFRAGYQSYHLEIELNKRGLRFKKYGGLRYTEASHIKDMLSYVRLLVNPLDLPAFERVAALTKGIGPKTAQKIYQCLGQEQALQKACAKYPGLWEDLCLLDSLRRSHPEPLVVVEKLVEQYRPRLEELYIDDWPRRLQGLEEMAQIAAGYEEIDLFLADIALETPEEQNEEAELHRLTLSTVHSAKGLEWSAVIIIDLVEDRFPSRHALVRPDDFEEERRLLYVACTRARDSLDLFVPVTMSSRGSGGREPATPSPFVRELPAGLVEEIYENYSGVLLKSKAREPQPLRADVNQPGLRPNMPWMKTDGEHSGTERQCFDTERQRFDGDSDDEYQQALAQDPSMEKIAPEPRKNPEKLGFCSHKIFGRGKIVEALPPDKYRVNFPGIGLKVIMSAYLSLEDS